MGTHSKSNKEVRKRKYAEQFAKTAENKKRKAKKKSKAEPPMSLHSVYNKRCKVLDLGTYIRLILIKKNMTQKDIVNKVNNLGIMEDGAIFTKQKLSNILNGIIPLSKSNAYRIEKALDLEEGSLKRFITGR